MNWWSNRSKHQWWVMSCFLISATSCCHPMHSQVTGLTQTQWPVLKVRVHWNYRISLQPFGTGMSVTTKDCFGQMINEVQTQSVKVRVEIQKNDAVVDPGQRWPWGHMLSAQSCVKFWESCFSVFSHITKRYAGLCRTQTTKTPTRWYKTDEPVRAYFASMAGWLYVMHYMFSATAI